MVTISLTQVCYKLFSCTKGTDMFLKHKHQILSHEEDQRLMINTNFLISESSCRELWNPRHTIEEGYWGKYGCFLIEQKIP